MRVRVKGSGSTGTTAETLRIVLPELPEATGAIFVRRGPATGNKEIPTADLRYRRSEQLRVELPTPFPGTGERAIARSHRESARRPDHDHAREMMPTAADGRSHSSRWRRWRRPIT